MAWINPTPMAISQLSFDVGRNVTALAPIAEAALFGMQHGDEIGACGVGCGDGAGEQGDDGHQDPGE